MFHTGVLFLLGFNVVDGICQSAELLECLLETSVCFLIGYKDFFVVLHHLISICGVGDLTDTQSRIGCSTHGRRFGNGTANHRKAGHVGFELQLAVNGISAAHSTEQLDRAIAAFQKAGQELGII